MIFWNWSWIFNELERVFMRWSRNSKKEIIMWRQYPHFTITQLITQLPCPLSSIYFTSAKRRFCLLLGLIVTPTFSRLTKRTREISQEPTTRQASTQEKTTTNLLQLFSSELNKKNCTNFNDYFTSSSHSLPSLLVIALPNWWMI